MIDEIDVSNLALIRQASIEPSPGMTAITGETGAGKTALLASCRLIMGERSAKELVREGEDEASVVGRLFLAAGREEQEVVVDRRVAADGRSRVKVNGQMASVAELAALVSPSIALCSQHDQRLLASQRAQREMLDAWAGEAQGALLSAYKSAFLEAKDAHEALEQALHDASASDERLEDACFKLRQIDSVNPSSQDYEELLSSLRKAENAELLARAASEAKAALSGEGGALDALNGAIALLDDGGKVDEALRAMSQSLREAAYVAEDVARDVSSYSDAMDVDVSMLDQMQERASAYQSLLRSYGPSVEDVLRTAEEARLIIAARENADVLVRDAQRRVSQAEEALANAADALEQARFSAAPAFSDAVNSVLSRLEMSGAGIEVQIERLPRDGWTESGPDEVRFMFRAAAGMQARPLSRIASGGELSRVMLAIRAAMGEKDDVATLIFDEVDAGVGGAVALALGEVLAELSRTHQVIVVTHLAQVASKADVHYMARKDVSDGVAVTTIELVEGNARVEEVARMLSGTLTESSAAHARELLLM